MATTASLPAVRHASRSVARPSVSGNHPQSGTSLFLLFAASLTVGVVPIVAMILEPTWLVMGVASAVTLGLTFVILASVLRHVDA